MITRVLLGALVAGVVALSATTELQNVNANDWESLFNGEDLSGWENRSGDDSIWRVKDGVIDCDPKVGGNKDKSLWSADSYEDFELIVEWRIKETKGKYNVPTVLPDGSHKTDAEGNTIITPMPNADSGIYLRGTSKAQVNIWCWPVGSGEVYGYRMDDSMPAEVRAGVTPSKKMDNMVGEWNTFNITMKGDHLTVMLNGEKVVDSELPGVPARGPLALQHHGGYDAEKDTWNPASSLVQFRNIKIREL
jgi:hypothetical protein